MAGYLDEAKNRAIVTVSIGYDAAATSIALAASEGSKLPGTTEAYNLTWWNATDYANPADDPNVEIIRVTSRSGDTLTVTRAQEGDTAKTHNISAKTYKMHLGFTKKTRDDIDAKLNWVRSAFRGKLSADQVHAGAQTDTLIPFDEEDIDLASEFDEGGDVNKFKAKKAGVYLLHVQVYCTGQAANDQFILTFRKNGSTQIAAKRILWNAAAGSVDLTTIESLAVNDTVDVLFTSGAGITIVGNTIRTRFLGTALGIYAAV